MKYTVANWKGKNVMKRIICIITVLGLVTTTIANEPAYKVSDMSVEGEIQGENIVFTLKCNIDVSKKDVVVPLVASENVAYIDGQIPYRARLEWNKTGYSLRFTRAFSGSISFKFASKPEKSGDWRTAKFSLPMATITKVSVLCDRTDLEVHFPDALDTKREKTQDGRTRVTAFLTATDQLVTVWKPEVRKLEGELAVACEANTIAIATVGALKLDTVLNYRVIQGGLNKITLKLHPELNITQVTGPNIQSWTIDRTDHNTPKLLITLTSPQESVYILRVESEIAIPQLPCSVEIPNIIPENVLRTSGFLMIGTDSAIKLQVEKQTGVTQIDPAGFPIVATTSVDVKGKTMDIKRLKPTRSIYCYQYVNLPYTLFMKAEDVITTFVVDDDISVLFADNDLTYNASLTIDIKDAPAREILLTTDADAGWVITSISGRYVSEADVDIREEKNQRVIYVPFKEAVQGTIQIVLHMEKTLKSSATTFKVPTVRVSGAKSEQGTIIIGAEKGIRLIPEKIVNMREAYTGTRKLREAATQHAFRFKAPDWSATFTIERAAPSVYAEVFHLFSIGEGVMYCSSAITYHIENSPIHQLKVRVPKNVESVEFTGKDIESWKKQDDICTVNFQSRLLGDYTLLVTYNIPFSYQGATLTIGNTETVSIENEVGYIVIASPVSLDVKEEQPLPASVIKIGEEEVPADYLLTVKHPVLKAFKYTRNPHPVTVKLTPFETERPIGQLADYVKLETRVMRNGDSITTATFFLKNASRQHMVVKLSPDSTLWSIKQVEESNNKRDIPSQVSKDKILIPVIRHLDPNTPIIIEMVFAQSHRKKLSLWHSGLMGLDFSGPTVAEAHISFAKWKISVPKGFSIAYAKGNMSSDENVHKTGFIGVIKLSANLCTSIILGKRWKRILKHIDTLILDEINRGNSSEYTATVRLAGTEAPHLNIRIVPSWMGAGNLPMVTLLTFGLGIIMLARGALRRRRAVPLATGITLLLFATAQLSVGRCVLAILLLICMSVIIFIGLGKIFKASLQRMRRQIIQSKTVKNEPMPPPPFEPANETGEVTTSSTPPTSLITFIALFLWFGMGIFSIHADEVTQLTEPDVKSVAISIYAPPFSRETEKSAKITSKFVFEVQNPTEFNVIPPTCALTAFEPKSRYLEIIKKQNGYYLKIKRSGRYEAKFDYTAPVSERDGKWKIEIAVPKALTTTSSIIIPEQGIEVKAEGYTFFKSEYKDTNTVAEALFAPMMPVVFSWSPRQRETKREITVFLCEANTLLTIRPGVVDALTSIKYQIPQGEIKELRIKMPAGMSVTSVQGANVATWSFEPKERLVDIILQKPVSTEYNLQISSQMSCEDFPYTASIGMLSVHNAARQRGVIAIAGPENVQIKVVQSKTVVPINIEDFPVSSFYDGKKENVQTTTVRKTFRYDRAEDVLLSVHAEPTPPEIRVEENASITIADSRIVLSTSLKILVAKSGIFSTRILLPAKFDIETISGPDVSHWVEQKTVSTNDEREVVIYFKREIINNTLLNLILAKIEHGVEEKISVPKIRVKDVKKHFGRLTILSEKGIKFNVESHTGIDITKTYDDKLKPSQDFESRRSGVLKFDILRPDWEITLKTQILSSVVKPELLYHINITEGILQCNAFIRYKIENAGIKTFQLLTPSPGLILTITGQNIARVHEIDKEKGIWQVDLHNKHEDVYSMNVSWQEAYPYDMATPSVVKIRPIRTVNTEASQGYLAITCSGHVEVRPEGEPSGIKLEDVRNVPPEFHRGAITNAILCYRILKTDYELNVSIVRHESATVLPAEVQNIELTSVVSEDSKMLTRVELSMNIRNMRFLKVLLPNASDSIWTASVNGKEVSVSRDRELYCIPLESKDNFSSSVEFVYSSSYSQSSFRKVHLFKAPVFQNLPLNNIKWNFYLPVGWRLKQKDTSLELKDYLTTPLMFDETQYMQRTRMEKMARISSARERLVEATKMLKEGKQKSARKAFEEAYIYSQGIADHLSEDSRIQLRNLSQQQITVGLYNRRSALRTSQQNILPAQESQTELRQQMEYHQQGEYSQDYAVAVEKKLPPSEKSALQEVANKIIGQQSAAGEVVPAIKHTIPTHGRFVSLKKSALIDPQEELKVYFVTSGLFSMQLFQLFWPTILVFIVLLCYISSRSKHICQSDKN